jgi:threonyl-tRNA synthetase
VQAVGIPVADTFADYLGDVMTQMRKAGIRAELDASDDRMQKKVRNAQMQKIPFMVIAGEEDQKAGAVSFRYRNGEQKNGIPIADAIAEIKKVVAERTQV